MRDLDETDLLLLEAIESGEVIACLDENGEVVYYHIEHTDDEMLENALSVSEVERLMRNEETD